MSSRKIKQRERNKKNKKISRALLGRPGISRPSLLLLFPFYIHLLNAKLGFTYIVFSSTFHNQLKSFGLFLLPYQCYSQGLGGKKRGEVCPILWSALIPNPLMAIPSKFQWTQRRSRWLGCFCSLCHGYSSGWLEG